MCTYVILVDRIFNKKAQKVTFISPKQAIQSRKQGIDPVCFRTDTWQQKQALYNNVKAHWQPWKKVYCLHLKHPACFFQPHEILHYHKQHQCYWVTTCLSEHLSCLVIQQFKIPFFFPQTCPFQNNDKSSWKASCPVTHYIADSGHYYSRWAPQTLNTRPLQV